MSPSKTLEVVRFCENCCGAFDVKPTSRRDLCDECRHEARLEWRRAQAEHERVLNREHSRQYRLRKKLAV